MSQLITTKVYGSSRNILAEFCCLRKRDKPDRVTAIIVTGYVFRVKLIYTQSVVTFYSSMIDRPELQSKKVAPDIFFPVYQLFLLYFKTNFVLFGYLLSSFSRRNHDSGKKLIVVYSNMLYFESPRRGLVDNKLVITVYGCIAEKLIKEKTHDY
ncbi:hypothetical protein BY458DRAFT_486181 [Sporodiniella umbellata]|nr:hypothetical protein BY458DRAFT_486181 [Sporodiniella umbellata]